MSIIPRDQGGRNRVRAYIPENLELDFLPAGRQDAARYLVGRLYLGRHVAGKDPDEFQELYSPLLQSLLGADYRRGILDPMLAHGVIEEDPSYSTGLNGKKGYSKGFRLAPHFRHEQFRAVTLTHPEMVRRLEAHRADRDSSLDALVYRHLRAWHNRLTVIQDYPEDVLPLRVLADGEHRFDPCRQGRLHTNLSNLARRYRKFLALEGVTAPLMAIDIKTSQPLLLGLTLKNRAIIEQDNGFCEYAKNKTEAWDGRKKGKGERERLNRIPYVGGCSSECLSDLQGFIDTCLSGDLYNRFVEETGYTRDQVKKFFLATVYGRPGEAGATKTGQAFRRLFPRMWEELAALNANNQSRLPCFLQTVESWLVIWRTCGRLAREFPEAPLLTIHDCLVTTEEYVEPCRRVLLDEFQAVWGVQPQTDTKALAA